jgi:hypothetical protein
MDADGTWHNLKPIARLAVSGPDQEPRRYSDPAFGSGWFVAKAAAAAEDGSDAEKQNGDAPTVTAEPNPDDSTATGSHARPEAPQDTTAKAGDSPSATGTPDAKPQDDETADGAGGRAHPRTEKELRPQEISDLGRHLPLSAADLDAIRWRLDGGTLREVVDDRSALRELGERLDGPLADEADNVVKAGLLSVRAEVYRLLGELGMAAAASRLALAHAESAQDEQSMVIAQAELAHVLRLRGDWMEADRLFQRAVDSEVPAAVRSVVHENARSLRAGGPARGGGGFRSGGADRGVPGGGLHPRAAGRVGAVSAAFGGDPGTAERQERGGAGGAAPGRLQRTDRRTAGRQEAKLTAEQRAVRRRS